MLKYLCILILIISLFMVGCGKNQPNYQLNQQEIDQISQDFAANSITAREKYKDKYVLINGTFTRSQSKDTIEIHMKLNDVKDCYVTISVKPNFFQDMDNAILPQYVGDPITFIAKLDVDNIKVENGSRQLLFNKEVEYIKPDYKATIPRDTILEINENTVSKIITDQHDNRFRALAEYIGLKCRVTGKIMEIKDGNYIVITTAGNRRIGCQISSEDIKKIVNGQTINIIGTIKRSMNDLVFDNAIVKIFGQAAEGPNKEAARMVLTNCILQ